VLGSRLFAEVVVFSEMKSEPSSSHLRAALGRGALQFVWDRSFAVEMWTAARRDLASGKPYSLTSSHESLCLAPAHITTATTTAALFLDLKKRKNVVIAGAGGTVPAASACSSPLNFALSLQASSSYAKQILSPTTAMPMEPLLRNTCGVPSPGKVQNGAIHHHDVAYCRNYATVTTPAALRLGSAPPDALPVPCD